MLLNDVFSDLGLSIEKVSLPKGENLSFEPSFSELWIVKKGSLSVILGREQRRFIEFGQVFFLPPGDSCILVSEQSTQCLRLSIPDCVALCGRFFSPGLIKEKAFFCSSFNSLEMSPLIWEYSRHLDVLFDEYVLTSEFLHIKVTELFHVLSYSYSNRQLAGLFHPILKVEEAFARFVEDNYPRLRTARELAKESHMSLRSFENKFKYVFGTSPGKWIIRKKMQIVYVEIVTSSLPLAVIADKCGFATLSHMTDFCKKHLGMTPSQIRKGRML